MERWLPVAGFEGHYEVSDQGRVKSVERWAWNGHAWHILRGRVLKMHLNTHGYPKVILSKEGKLHTGILHNLVTRAFLGDPPPGCEVAHLDGTRDNNHIENLIYTTKKINQGHRRLHGTHQDGEANAMSKLTEQDVLDIRELGGLGISQGKLSKEFKVFPATIHKIQHRQRWAHLP